MASQHRLRILFVIGSMGGGGAERQVLEILKRLDRNRFEPFLYLAIKQGEFLPDVPSDVPIFAYWDGTPESLLGRILRWMKLTRLMRYVHLARILRDQQIDVVYDRTYLATLDAAGGCWFRPTPRVSVCVADPGPDLRIHSRFSITLSRWFARRAYASASVVVTNSEGLRQRVIDFYRLNPQHVRVLQNLLSDVRGSETTSTKVSSIGRSKSAEDDFRRMQELLASAKNSFVIMTAGRLHQEKGQQVLLRAVDELIHRRHRSLSLIIFGQGEAEVELRNYIHAHGLETFVLLPGFVTEPRDYYTQGSLFVLPSFFEGMPNALIEAIVAGLPALATTCPSGPKEILDHGRCGTLVEPGDWLGLANAIEDAMDHPEAWKNKADLAYDRVLKMFDPQQGIGRLEQLLQEVAGSGNASAKS